MTVIRVDVEEKIIKILSISHFWPVNYQFRSMGFHERKANISLKTLYFHHKINTLYTAWILMKYIIQKVIKRYLHYYASTQYSSNSSRYFSNVFLRPSLEAECPRSVSDAIQVKMRERMKLRNESNDRLVVKSIDSLYYPDAC